MKISGTKKKKHYGLADGKEPALNDVLIETVSEDSTRRYIVSGTEWLLIKAWYCDPSRTEDYYLTLNTEENSQSLVRLDKKLLEIRITELSPKTIFSKNVLSVALSSVPRMIGSVTAFVIALIAWVVFGITALVKGAEITPEMLSHVITLSTVIFIVFLLLNAEVVIIRIAAALRNKYKAFEEENETPLTSTWVFNALLLIIFSFGGVKGLIALVKKILELLGS